MPAVHADAALVRQLLDNLIANAVKYVAPGRLPRVAVTGASRWAIGSRSPSPTRASASPRPSATTIFEAFHRAHDDEQYDGHGIGLAVCKKIVERHGGRIAARPPLDGVGTRIVFTLPARPRLIAPVLRNLVIRPGPG